MGQNVKGSCPRCRKPITVKVDLHKQVAYAMPCYRCGVPGVRIDLRQPTYRGPAKLRKNPPYEKAELLYRKALAFLKPSSNAPEGEKVAARNLAFSMLDQYPQLWKVVGPAPGLQPPKAEPEPEKPGPAGFKYDYGFDFGFDKEKIKREAAEERAKQKREAAKAKARREKRVPKEPKPAWARRRPEGWTYEDEVRLAEAERAKLAAKKGGFQGKPFPDERAPENVVAAAMDGILIWCGTGVAVLYVLGHARSKHRTCDQAHAAADVWYAESPTKRIPRYPRYESYGAMMPHRVS